MPSCAMNKELYSQISSFKAKLIILKFLDSKTGSTAESVICDIIKIRLKRRDETKMKIK